MKKFLLIAALLIPFTSVYAQSENWRDQNGKPLPETPSVKSHDGFGGTVVITSDGDWKQKWETPPGSTPKLTVAQTVEAGRTITLLIFFTNPKLDAAGNADVRCEVRLVDPKGKSSVLRKDGVCYDGPIGGPPANVYLSRPTFAFTFNAKDAADLPGVWSFDVTLRDEGRKVSLPLRASVELK